MIPIRGLVQGLKGWLGKPVASPDSDPQRFFGPLFAMPNPDPILREMGRAEQVYNSIAADAHVLGDIRSIRGNFRGHDYRIESGDEGNAQADAAAQLCRDWMQRTRPNHLADWLEVMWQMSFAFGHGYRAHELVWQISGGKYLPCEVVDRPNRRFRFNAYGEPLLISTGNMLGAPVEPYQFVVSRHMPTMDNPYGVASLSSCFWPWTFKTGGWRYFVKYAERHGLPWPIGRYPQGTDDKEIDRLADALANMLEAGYVVTQDGNGVELLVPTNSGTNLPQERLIDKCNTEMSKALTGQAMVAELQGVGARAASETALKRQESIDDSVRDIAAQSMDYIFRWITLFNFGDGIAPPCLYFFRQENAGKERAETYQLAKAMGANPSKSALLEELGIPEAKDEGDTLQSPQPPAVPGAAPGEQRPTQARTAPADNADTGASIDLSGVPGWEFAKAAGMTEAEAVQLAADAADQAIEDHLIAPIVTLLDRLESDGKTLADFQAALADVVGEMDDQALREVLDRALSYSILKGAATKAL